MNCIVSSERDLSDHGLTPSSSLAIWCGEMVSLQNIRGMWGTRHAPRLTYDFFQVVYMTKSG